MKILFVGVFTEGSTNISQYNSLTTLGHAVDEFPYRSIPNCNVHLETHSGYDVVLIAKGTGITTNTIKQLKRYNGKIVYWFPDPAISFTSEMIDKTAISDIAFFDKLGTLDIAKTVNENSHYICEGYDSKVDIMHDVEKEYDVSFIGNVYGNRASVLEHLTGVNDVKVISSAYGVQHAIEVGKSKINLNICTDGCASDRIYKSLAAGGFILTDDWYGRELTGLVDGADLVIYNNISDLQTKIKYYLHHEDLRTKISHSGLNRVKDLNRINWAKEIVK